mmetsp:Transcript_35068/g.66099  ORF Transcript_35068/g.66099 Transcript_35068/m.66099 type:complete len:367 (+) Transcript_35068:114-1214(+)
MSKAFLLEFLHDAMHSANPSETVKLLAAAQYSVASLGIMFANKIVLTTYDFPSFATLTMAQFATTCMLLSTAKWMGWIHFPDNDIRMFNKVFPLQLLFLVSTVFSLGGTKHINMPMFVMLRRFTILFTMVAEFCVAGIKPSSDIVGSVVLLCFGAMVAVTDFHASSFAVGMILVANLCQALSVVVSKMKMDVKEGLGPVGLLMYNSFYSMICFLPFFTYGSLHEEFQEALQHPGWKQPGFVALFIFSCLMASLLNFSILLCTKVNSALTTMVVGVIKNLVTTYLGMFVGNDYVFTWLNFTGLNISVVGSLVYTWLKHRESQSKRTAAATKLDSTEEVETMHGERLVETVIKKVSSVGSAMKLTQPL